MVEMCDSVQPLTIEVPLSTFQFVVILNTSYT